MTPPPSRPDRSGPNYDDAYRGRSELGEIRPWDIPGPQPAHVEVEMTGVVVDPILDCGCGTGENSLHLASKGYRVTGVDLAPTAVALARRKALARGLDVDFRVADVLDLSGFVDFFNTVVDSGMAHVFELPDLMTYVAALHQACRPGATAIVLGIDQLRAHESSLVDAVSKLMTTRPPHEHRSFPMTTADTLRRAFLDGWTVESISESSMRALLPITGQPIEVPALLGRFVRE